MNKNPFSGKKILLGVTGCIAAYKSAYLVRELTKRGADVRVIMTPSAAEFITPLTLSALSKNHVIVNIFPKDQTNSVTNNIWHIDLALWADLMIVAPATINTVAKIAHGFADNALTTLVSALRSPCLISPAADVDMYENKITRENFKKLESLGYHFVYAEDGELASGLKGTGRLAEIEKIIDAAEIIISGYQNNLAGKKILITAGPTYEDIDPVRFIGNRSSGKMGFALAKAAYLRGAEVTLISGPTSEYAYPEIKVVNIRSASEMKKAVDKELKFNDVLIMSAAVADYKPQNSSLNKIKKQEKLTKIDLSLTDDILSSIKKDDKIVIGFSLETDNEKKNAAKKLKEKNLNMIVLNSLKDKQSGFEFDTNKITIIGKDNKSNSFPLQSKFQAANKILDELQKL